MDNGGEPDNEGETVVPSAKKRKTNKKGLAINGNGAVSMRDLDLSLRVPTKIRNDDDAPDLFKAKVSLSKASTFFTSCPGVSTMWSLHQCPHFSFHYVVGISCSMSWTRSFVLSWSSTSRCRYGTPPAKRPWMNCLMPKSMCKF